MWPQRRQPTRLPRPLDSPAKNTGVGCHFLLQCVKVKSESEVAQLCPTLRDPMDCSPPGSSVHKIFQARVLEWGAIAFSETMALLPHKTCFRSPFIISYSMRTLRTRIWSVTRLGGAIYAQKTQILCFLRPSSSALGIWGPMNPKMSLKKKNCQDFPKQMFPTFQWITYEDKDRCEDLQRKKKNLTPPSVNLLA